MRLFVFLTLFGLTAGRRNVHPQEEFFKSPNSDGIHPQADFFTFETESEEVVLPERNHHTDDVKEDVKTAASEADLQTKEVARTPKKRFSSEEVPQCQQNQKALVYYQRAISMLFNHLRSRSASDKLDGVVRMLVTDEDLQTLYQFSKGDETVGLDAVDKILNKMMKKSPLEKGRELVFTAYDHFVHIAYNPTFWTALATLWFLYVVYCLKTSRLTWRSIKIWLLFVAYVCDFAVTYVHLYKIAESDRLHDAMQHKNLPLECQPNKMSFWQYASSIVLHSGGDCKSYYRQKNTSAFLDVTVVSVLGEQFRRLGVSSIVNLCNDIIKVSKAEFGMWGFLMAPAILIAVITCFGFLWSVLHGNAPFFSFFFNLLSVGTKAKSAQPLAGKSRVQDLGPPPAQRERLVRCVSVVRTTCRECRELVEEHEEEEVFSDHGEDFLQKVRHELGIDERGDRAKILPAIKGES